MERMTVDDVRRDVDRIWAVRTSGNHDAAERAEALELSLYRRIITATMEQPQDAPTLVYAASGAHPTARTWVGFQRPDPA